MGEQRFDSNGIVHPCSSVVKIFFVPSRNSRKTLLPPLSLLPPVNFHFPIRLHSSSVPPWRDSWLKILSFVFSAFFCGNVLICFARIRVHPRPSASICGQNSQPLFPSVKSPLSVFHLCPSVAQELFSFAPPHLSVNNTPCLISPKPCAPPFTAAPTISASKPSPSRALAETNSSSKSPPAACAPPT